MKTKAESGNQAPSTKNQAPAEGAKRFPLFITLRRRLDEEQMRRAFSALDEDDPRWIGIQQVLAEEMAGAVVDCADAKASPEARAHAGGNLDALARVLNRLLELRGK
jgi:hypothetical protein